MCCGLSVFSRAPSWSRWIVVNPVIDWHSGLPYSLLDEHQTCASFPNSERFPPFFSLDLELGREFRLRLPWVRNHVLRGALTVFNLSNHTNPRDVYNNIAPPCFNHFVGLQDRFFDTELDILY